jgi:hypothetical protein
MDPKERPEQERGIGEENVDQGKQDEFEPAGEDDQENADDEQDEEIVTPRARPAGLPA